MTEYRWHKAGRFVKLLGPGKGTETTYGVRFVVGARHKLVTIELTEREIIDAISGFAEALDDMRKAREHTEGEEHDGD